MLNLKCLHLTLKNIVFDTLPLGVFGKLLRRKLSWTISFDTYNNAMMMSVNRGEEKRTFEPNPIMLGNIHTMLPSMQSLKFLIEEEVTEPFPLLI